MPGLENDSWIVINILIELLRLKRIRQPERIRARQEFHRCLAAGREARAEGMPAAAVILDRIAVFEQSARTIAQLDSGIDRLEQDGWV